MTMSNHVFQAATFALKSNRSAEKSSLRFFKYTRSLKMKGGEKDKGSEERNEEEELRKRERERERENESGGGKMEGTGEKRSIEE